MHSPMTSTRGHQTMTPLARAGAARMPAMQTMMQWRRTRARSRRCTANAVAAAVSMLICACVSWAERQYAACTCAFCVAYSAAGVLSLSKHAGMMAAVNDGLELILSDTAGGTMQALLHRSNSDDEYLQLMLLTTGYLRRIDETPPWLCLPLPPPLHTLRHQTISAYTAGYADIVSCIPVTYEFLYIACLAAACVALVAFLCQCKLLGTVKRSVRLQ